MTRRTALAVLGALVSFASTRFDRPAAAWAHSLLVESIPKAGAEATVPSRMQLRFNSRIEPAFASVRVMGPGTDIRLPRVAGAGDGPDTVFFDLPALKPGAYQARWRIMSADGHIVEGTLRFSVPTVQGAR